MPIRDFFGRLLGHTALAAVLLYACFLTLEKLIPGFVSPMVDVAQTGLVALALVLAASLLTVRSDNRWRDIGSSLVYLVFLAVALSYLWTRIQDTGLRGHGLLAVAAITGGVLYLALWRERLAR